VALVVTSPQDIAIDDVRRSVGFCRELGNPVLGIVENLSGFHCPQCGTVHDIFKSGGGERLAEAAGVSFLGRIPIDGKVGTAADQGEAYLAVKSDSPAAKAFRQVVVAAQQHVAGSRNEAANEKILETAPKSEWHSYL
jgi:MinD superfamily P-loop ATPase